MDWRRKIVTCLMLATLLVATSTPVKSARPGFGAWRIGRVGGGQRPRVQNNRPNTGGWTGYHGNGRVNTGNAQYIRAMESMGPSLAQDYQEYWSQPGNRGIDRKLAATPDFWTKGYIRQSVPYYFPVPKSATDAPSYRNNYQSPSYASYRYQADRRRERGEQEKRNTDEWRNVRGTKVRRWKDVDYSNRRSAEGESTTARVTTDNGENGKRLLATITSADGKSVRYVYF